MPDAAGIRWPTPLQLAPPAAPGYRRINMSRVTRHQPQLRAALWARIQQHQPALAALLTGAEFQQLREDVGTVFGSRDVVIDVCGDAIKGLIK